MELVSYDELINNKFCSRDFINLLCENHDERDVQIFLSVISEKYSIEELSDLTKLSLDEIKGICKVFYDKYYRESGEKSSRGLGWQDSSKHRNNPKMGSYKGY